MHDILPYVPHLAVGWTAYMIATASPGLAILAILAIISTAIAQGRKAELALGQCIGSALVVQDVFGGELLKTRVGDDWHFYNRIDGERFDLTAEQFEGAVSYDDLPASREDAFSDTSPEQYKALRAALEL